MSRAAVAACGGQYELYDEVRREDPVARRERLDAVAELCWSCRQDGRARSHRFVGQGM
ncbi:MAG: hypothetical protein ACRDRG_00525 [Pseudonocardiaceae bacterium]